MLFIEKVQVYDSFLGLALSLVSGSKCDPDLLRWWGKQGKYKMTIFQRWANGMSNTARSLIKSLSHWINPGTVYC
jgi:hypothetical protein